MDTYEYGFNLGFEAGKNATYWIKQGKNIDHGNLLSSNDPYAIGYRKGLNIQFDKKGQKV